MTSSVANDLFLALQRRIFSPHWSWKWRLYIYFFKFVLRLVFQIQKQGVKEELLRAMLWSFRKVASYTLHLELIFFCHRIILFFWNCRSPEMFSSLNTSDCSLYYQLYCWKLHFSITNCASVACDCRIKRGVLPYTIYLLFF